MNHMNHLLNLIMMNCNLIVIIITSLLSVNVYHAL